MAVDRVSAVRLALRRAVGRLPERQQLRLRRATAALRGRDWADRVGALHAREAATIAGMVSTHALPGRPQRVLVSVLQQLPPIAEVSYSLAMALRLRGHDVSGVLCDGVLPLCEMNLSRLERPPCGVCAAWTSRYEAAFGCEFSRLTSHLTSSDRIRAEQIVAETPADRRLDLVVDGVAVGRIARRELQRYHRGFVFDPAADAAFSRWIVSAVLVVWLAARLLEEHRPDILVLSSGRTLLASCLGDVARARGIRVVSWDLENSHPDGLVFSHGEPAVLLPLDEAWSAASATSLTAGERRRLRHFMRGWARSEQTPLPYNHAPIEDEAEIRSQLRLRSGAPLIVAFTNAAWDMAAVDRDAGFSDMFDWLFAVVDYVHAHPEIDLVVRAHPAEVNVSADLKSRTPVGAEIRKRYGALPANIRLLEGDTRVSSYVLASMAAVPIMYATRLGLEMALRGRRAWMAGLTTYRGRGFTRDIGSRQEMEALLDARVFNEPLRPDEVALAERFAYLWFFRYVVRVPLLRPAGQPFALRSFSDLAPGGDPVIDRICGALISSAPFLDMNPPEREGDEGHEEDLT